MRLHVFIETGIPEGKRKKGEKTNEWYFIHQFIKHIKPEMPDDDIDIIDVGGKDALHLFANKFVEFSLNKEPMIVIFDCDNEEKGGGLKNRVAKMEEFKKKNGVDFDYFFFPNNSDDGDFEEMLLHIINEKHRGIIKCFEAYEMCVGGQNAAMGEIYETPNNKAKTYTYITSFKRTDKVQRIVKGGNWDFSNPEYWNLDSDYLNPLKEAILSLVHNKA